ncbi:hypothetical protein B0I12_003557 [Microbacterium hydrothermale]|uniref:hypothetical protein n=1 Tax=Microbacterium hydrothermale TaxID=857427 RepID=UPI00222669AE|nr:hypothetical protein [Microbacterium hydrothermale]MCW2166385.1 hypothetical protein [Microbacterium hydrothermale]
MSASDASTTARRLLDGGLALAALVPFAVLGLIGAVVCLTSLAGTGSGGEEGKTLVLSLLLGAVSVAFCLLAAGASARGGRLSWPRALCLVAFVTILWTAATFGLWGTGALLLVADLPWAFSLMVVTGFTLPVAGLGILGLVVVGIVRRARGRGAPDVTEGPGRLGG